RKGAAVDAPLELDGDGLALQDLLLNGQPLATVDYDATPERLAIRNLPADAKFEIQIITRISPVTNKALMGLYQSNGVFCTQCEAEGFRRITYYLDRPDVLSVYSVRIEARKSEAPL